MSCLQKCFDDGLLHVSLLILLLVEDELVKVVLQVVRDAGAAVAVVDGEESQLGVALEVRKRGTPEI